MAGDAVRLAQGVDGVAVEIGDGRTVHLVRRAGVELQVARERHGVGAGLPERLADVAGLEQREFVRARQHALADAGEDAAALGRRQASPLAIERGLRRRNRGVDVATAAARDLAQRLARRRIAERQCLPAPRLPPLACNQALRRIESKRVDHVPAVLACSPGATTLACRASKFRPS